MGADWLTGESTLEDLPADLLSLVTLHPFALLRNSPGNHRPKAQHYPLSC